MTFAQLCHIDTWDPAAQAVAKLLQKLSSADERSPAETHGLLYALASIIREVFNSGAGLPGLRTGPIVWSYIIDHILRRRAKTDAEIDEAMAALLAALCDYEAESRHSKSSNKQAPSEGDIMTLEAWLTEKLGGASTWFRPEILADTALALFKLMIPSHRQRTARNWLDRLSIFRGHHRMGIVIGLAATFEYSTNASASDTKLRPAILSTLVAEASPSSSIERRTHGLEWLRRGVLAKRGTVVS